MIHPLQKAIRNLEDKERAQFLMRFFKTGKGQYAEGDIFLGLTVPTTRSLVQNHLPDLTLPVIEAMLQSKYHEERLAALHALVYLVQKKTVKLQDAAELYLRNTARINNWDLIDTSAAEIIGAYCAQKNSIALLKKLAKSPLLWDRRIAMVSTFHFIKNGSNTEAFTIATLLLHDTEDLMHKAVGWMLRETGKRVSEPELLSYINLHIKDIPSTALRYAIERCSPSVRAYYLELKRLQKKTKKPH